MSRNSARRHRGSYRQAPRKHAAAAAERSALHQHSALLKATFPEAEQSIRYWRKHVDTPQFVYFIQSVDGGPVKIGTAENPVKRLAMLQCGNPQELAIRQVLAGGREVEQNWHDYWRSAHLRGEWFDGGAPEAIVLLAHGVAEQQIEANEVGRDLHHCLTNVPKVFREVRMLGHAD